MKRSFDLQVKVLDSMVTSKGIIRELENDTNERTAIALRAQYASDIISGTLDPLIEATAAFADKAPDGMPKEILGFSNGGDFMAPIRYAIGAGILGSLTKHKIY